MNTMNEHPETTPQVNVTATTPAESAPAQGVCTSEPEATPETSTGFWKRHAALIIASVVALMIVLGAGYYAYTEYYAGGGVVAEVNGKKIYQKEFDESLALITQSATAQGVDLTDESVLKAARAQALEVLVSNALLITAASKAGIEVTDADVETKYGELVTELGSAEELTKRLAEIGLSEEKLRSNIRERVLADRYIESATDIENVTATDEEVTAFVASLGDMELPPLEEIRPQIEAEIIAKKQQALVTDLIEKLRAEATIETKM